MNGRKNKSNAIVIRDICLLLLFALVTIALVIFAINLFIRPSNKTTDDYKLLSELEHHKINEYIDFSIPTSYALMSNESRSIKYPYAENAIIVTDNLTPISSDLVIQLSTTDYISNELEDMNNLRNSIIDMYKLTIPNADYNADKMLEIEGKNIPILSFALLSDEDIIMNIFAFIEVSNDLVMLSTSYNIDNENGGQIFYDVLYSLSLK